MKENDIVNKYMDTHIPRALVFESDETTFNDEIFVERFKDINQNKIYKKPDYTRHYVKNVDRPLFLLDKRNVLMPIRHDNNMFMVGRTILSDDDIKKTNGCGVYIIERYIINDKSTVSVNALVDYYNHLSTITEITKGLVTKTIVENRTNLVIRIVTFIPEKDINFFNNVFIPNTELCITTELPKHDNLPKLVNPKSMEYIRSKEENNEDNVNAIEIDIVDNNLYSTSYFINVGGSVERFITHRDVNKQDSATITISKRGVAKKEIRVINPDDYVDHGIFKTYHEAEASGDVKGTVDKIKLIDAKETKTSNRHMDILKMSHQETMSKHDIKMRELEQKMFKSNATLKQTLMKEEQAIKNKVNEIDFKQKMLQIEEVHRNKMEYERTAFNNKHNSDNIKLFKDILKLSFDVGIFLYSVAKKA